MRNVVQRCLAANNILPMRKWNHAFLLLACLHENGRSLRFPKIFLKRPTRWSNDKTIVQLRYRKISSIVSFSQINYLPKAKASAINWSACRWQNTIFLLNLVQWLLIIIRPTPAPSKIKVDAIQTEDHTERWHVLCPELVTMVCLCSHFTSGYFFRISLSSKRFFDTSS